MEKWRQAKTAAIPGRQQVFLPTMMFLGILDMMMFSTMLGFMGMMMASYIPESQMPVDTSTTDTGTSTDVGDTGSDMGDGGEFDIDIGF